MNFELGKSYIVDVTEKGIIPSMEFDRSQWFNKDHDDLEFLTDEEKEVVYDRGYRDGHEAGYKVAHEAIANIIKRVLEGIKP